MLFIVCFSASGSFGQEASAEGTATTISDPEIPVGDLELLLKPLTKSELIVEAEAWLQLLKSKVSQISAAEIQMRQKSREIDQKEAETKKKIKEIEKTQEQTSETAAPSAESTQQPEQQAEVAADAEKEIQEKVEAIDQTESEIEEITTQSKAELESKPEEELSGLEEDLQEKTEEIIEAQEKIKDTVEEIAQADMELTEKVKKIGAAEVELQSKVKEHLLVNINKLREEQTSLIDRFKVVLSALKDKGGDVEEYEKYVAAVSGLSVDIQAIKDVSAFRIMIWGWLKSSGGGLRWLRNIVFFLLTLLAFYGLAYVLGRITLKTVSASKRFSDLLKNFFVNAVRRTVMLIGIIVALSMLEIKTAPFIASLGVAGFVLGFALQGTLSNFASGLMILMYRPYDVGQIIDAAGVKGVVDSMNLVSTTIKTFDNQIVVIPNGEIWGGVITNVTGSNIRRVDMVFGISYTDDIAKAAKILEDIVSKHELVLKEPKPIIRLHELGDSSVNFVCRPWVKTADYWTVYWDVTRTVKEQFDAEGISIPFPQQDVHIYQAAKSG
ncbi:MAG TPA: mechanosensitive ion channel family protein [Phycisphaerales bacterium]|nr:mechanosensitive ion channel family protein [Phycisphaerales bacterium]